MKEVIFTETPEAVPPSPGPRGRFSGTAARLAALCILLAAAAFPVAADGNPDFPEVRQALVDQARDWIGTPYLYAGSTRKGVDCSGFVFRVYQDVLGPVITTGLAKSSKGLHAQAIPVANEDVLPGDLLFFDTTGKGVSHVGLWAGAGRFIHAASDGPRTGVIESEITERYWSEHYLGAGRLLVSTGQSASGNAGSPAGAASGVWQMPAVRVSLHAGAGFSLGADPVLRSLEGCAGADLHLGDLVLGLGTRPSGDLGMGVFRLPALAVLGWGDFRLEAGPVFTLGEPSWSRSDGTTPWTAPADWLPGLVRLSWRPFRFPLGSSDCLEPWLGLSWNRYLPGDPGTSNQGDMFVASTTLNIELRWVRML